MRAPRARSGSQRAITSAMLLSDWAMSARLEVRPMAGRSCGDDAPVAMSLSDWAMSARLEVRPMAGRSFGDDAPVAMSFSDWAMSIKLEVRPMPGRGRDDGPAGSSLVSDSAAGFFRPEPCARRDEGGRAGTAFGEGTIRVGERWPARASAPPLASVLRGCQPYDRGTVLWTALQS